MIFQNLREGMIMNATTSDLFKRVLDLNEKDRAALAGLLITSLEEEPDYDLDALWRLETARRISELDSGEIVTIPWKDVKMRLMKSTYGG